MLAKLATYFSKAEVCRSGPTTRSRALNIADVSIFVVVAVVVVIGIILFV